MCKRILCKKGEKTRMKKEFDFKIKKISNGYIINYFDISNYECELYFITSKEIVDFIEKKIKMLV